MDIPAVQLADDEEVMLLVRRHWFAIAVRAFAHVFLFIALATVLSVVSVGTHTFALELYALALAGLVLWMHFFAAWSDHWLDVWIVTNKRVIDIEQKGFFRREVSSFALEHIQDMTCETEGLIATWLCFGDLRIQTASISSGLIMRQIPFPEEVKETIARLLEK